MSVRRDQRGQVLPIVAVCLLVFLGMAALAIDVGNAYLHQKRLKSAVDLALVSAAQKLPDTTAAGADAKTYVDRNWAKQDSTTVSTTVETGCVQTGCVQKDKVTISSSVKVPTFFAKLLGKDEVTIHARGAACGPCDAKIEKFDVVVVLDRSYSMCLDANNASNGCSDLTNAKNGVKALIGAFDPELDRIGLVALTSGDSVSPNSNDHTGSAFPCDGATASATSGKGPYYRSRGNFMDGTATSYDSWVMAPLQGGFKTGSNLNNSSPLIQNLNCLQAKYWTPIAPAIKEATKHLQTYAPRADAKKIMVFLGDGGANVQPMKRDTNGFALAQTSWYTASSGNNMKPCADAVGQAAAAKAAGIEIYTIGYDLNTSAANTCYENNRGPEDASPDVENNIDAKTTIRNMASLPTSTHYYEKASAGEVTTIFSTIARKITGTGVRIIE